MTQHNSLDVKFSNSQLNKLKSGRKNGTKVTLKLSSNSLLKILIMKFSAKTIHKFKSFVKLLQMVHQLI